MKQYAAYALVNGKDPDYNRAQKSLATAVELQMARGWQPIGGVIFIGLVTEQGTTNFVFCQALLMPPQEGDA